MHCLVSNLLLVLTVYINGADTKLYYSGNMTASYNNSTLYCINMGGSLLSYTGSMTRVAETCSVSSVWTSPPFYDKKIGCNNGTAGKQTTDGRNDKHVLVCADFCSEDKYQYIGMTTTVCSCYEDADDLISQPCNSILCPANQNDRCGQGDSEEIYQKGTQSGNVCRYRSFQGQYNGGIKRLALCTDLQPFICKVGDTDIIECSFNGGDSLVRLSEKNLGFVIGLTMAVLLSLS